MQLKEIAYFTEDVPAMTDFYQRLFGAEPVAQSQGMAVFMIGETKVFIHRFYTPESGDLPPENHIAYEVPDVDRFSQQLQSGGLNLEIPPQDYYWGRSAYLRDPNGHLIELIQAG